MNNNAFCAEVPFEVVTDENAPTLNKALTGKANPRTLIKPTIAPPSHDITVWRQNPNVEHSQINTKTPMNPRLAGFGCPEEPSADWPMTSIDYDFQVKSPYFNPIQPSIYTSTDQFSPINNNLGISYAPQFPNTVIEDNVGGNQIYFDTNSIGRNYSENIGGSHISYAVEERPFELLSSKKNEPLIFSSSRPRAFTSSGPDGVYDPRFSGYGASDRSYVDNLLGSAKFYYDDVNAVRMPSYVTRSKIDSCVTPYGDTYGDLKSGHLTLCDARKCAEKSWVDNSLDFRVDLSKSLMRKKNEEMVQRRLAPKYTMY